VTVNIWLIIKKGEPRIYTTTVQPDEERLAAWRREGFKILRAQTELPQGWDDPDAVVNVQAVPEGLLRVDSPGGE
jgi:hypothetical protein